MRSFEARSPMSLPALFIAPTMRSFVSPKTSWKLASGCSSSVCRRSSWMP